MRTVLIDAGYVRVGLDQLKPKQDGSRVTLSVSLETDKLVDGIVAGLRQGFGGFAGGDGPIGPGPFGPGPVVPGPVVRWSLFSPCSPVRVNSCNSC